MVDFENVKKSYGHIVALEEVSFSIDPGEFVFIVGPSGAGKTTILNLLIAAVKPTSGKVTVDGQPIQKLKRSQVPKFRQKIGVVFQDFRLLSERTIRENVEVVLAVAGISKKEWKSRVDQVLQLVGLSERSELFPAQLSGGELQRAAIARALVINPKVIFADEPTGNLDWKTAESIMELLEKINQEGKTLVVTSHNQEIVQKMKKRVIHIENGRVSKDTKHAG
jgi:cell division transport system ATP-binding protein